MSMLSSAPTASISSKGIMRRMCKNALGVVGKLREEPLCSLFGWPNPWADHLRQQNESRRVSPGIMAITYKSSPWLNLITPKLNEN